jgi:hypothetical protein
MYNFLINIFIEKKSKLCFEDCVAVLNDFFYQNGGSTYTSMVAVKLWFDNFSCVLATTLHAPMYSLLC